MKKGGGRGQGGCELAAVEVGRDLCFPGWVQRGVGWEGAGCCGEADGPGGEAAGLHFFSLSFLLPPLGARRRRQDKKLNRCQEGAAATRKWHSAPH